MHSSLGKWIILIGVLVVLGGIIIYFFGDKLNWIGRLPGDIRIERENVRVYIPITTMILASLMLTLIFRVAQALLK